MATDCGIGTPDGYTGPCNGRYQAKDAGAGIVPGLHASPVEGALVAAGVLVAVLLFAVFLSHAVGAFFAGTKDARRARRRAGSSRKFSAVVAEHLREHPEALHRGDATDLDRAGDTELDAEDDRESEVDEQEWETDSPAAREKFQ